MTTLFLGNGGFGLPTLRALHGEGYGPLAVVTRPDRPAGRGRTPTPTPTKSMARELGLPVLEIDDLKAPDAAERLRAVGADLWVVVAFPILPAGLLDIPPKGIVNLHASLLPRYRGAAPVQWALINGDRVTGVSTFFIDRGVDTGAVCMQREVPIPAEADAADLADLLSVEGAGLMLETVRRLESGTAPRVPQVPEHTTPAPRLKKEDGLLDWELAAPAVSGRVRGVTPWPGAYTFWGSERLLIGKVRPLGAGEVPWGTDTAPAPGTVAGFLEDGTPVAACGEGTGAALLLIQREGRRAAAGADVARGLRWQGGERLSGEAED